MNELKIFENKNFGKVRTLTVDNEPWFVGKDVAEILGYTNPSKALADHVDEEDKLNNETLSSLGQRGGWLINESGLYSLILSSKLPNAKKFKRWVTSEVLPSIRKTGKYSMTPQTYIQALEALVASEKEKEKLKIENKELEKTKAWISDKKTATAMNTASQKSKEVKKLKIELDRSKEYASIKAMEKVTKAKFKWQPMRNYCTSHELEMKKIFDPNFGAVNTYPAEAWKEVYGIDLDVFF